MPACCDAVRACRDTQHSGCADSVRSLRRYSPATSSQPMPQPTQFPEACHRQDGKSAATVLHRRHGFEIGQQSLWKHLQKQLRSGIFSDRYFGSVGHFQTVQKEKLLAAQQQALREVTSNFTLPALWQQSASAMFVHREGAQSCPEPTACVCRKDSQSTAAFRYQFVRGFVQGNIQRCNDRAGNIFRRFKRCQRNERIRRREMTFVALSADGRPPLPAVSTHSSWATTVMMRTSGATTSWSGALNSASRPQRCHGIGQIMSERGHLPVGLQQTERLGAVTASRRLLTSSLLNS